MSPPAWLDRIAGMADRAGRYPQSRRIAVFLVKSDSNARPWARAARLLRRSEFQRVYSSGVRSSTAFFVAFALRTEAPVSRIGLTTPRALGKATVRNRIKRRVREAARLNLPALGSGWDLVLNPRRAAGEADFAVLEKAVLGLFENLAQKAARPVQR